MNGLSYCVQVVKMHRLMHDHGFFQDVVVGYGFDELDIEVRNTCHQATRSQLQSPVAEAIY